MSTPAILLSGLHKRYPSVKALDGLSLEVEEGSICALLGGNGSGKTTTLKIIMGMVRPDEGSGRVLGHALEEIPLKGNLRERMGFVGEDRGLYSYMSCGQLITFTRSLFPSWRPDLEQRYLDEFQIPLDQTVRHLSKGMRTRLALLLALSRGAELLLLDEPTDGLDPATTEAVLQSLVSAVAQGTTVLLSTHRLAEVEQIADSVAVMERGRVILRGGLEALRENYRRIHLVFSSAPPALPPLEGVVSVRRQGRTLSLLVSGHEEELLCELKLLEPLSMELHPVGLKEIMLTTGTVS